MGSPTIDRILSVRDTRDYIEDGDRWVPVPGSGRPRPCDRCGRDHEIHVEVGLSDGSIALIGQGCARGDSMESAIRASVSAEQTRARLARQLQAAITKREAARQAWAAVERLPLPSPSLIEESSAPNRPRQIWGMGSAHVYCHGAFDEERRRCLIDSYRRDRYAERDDIPRGKGSYPLLPSSFDSEIADLERRLRAVIRKLPAPASLSK